MTKPNRISQLSNRMVQLEKQLERLNDTLTQQASVKQRRRRLLTIRFMMISVVGFAILFAWFGTVYRQSLRQAAAVDRLIDQSAFVLYSPRESALISLLPGEPHQPPASLVNLLGDDFFREVKNVSTGRVTGQPQDKTEILEALPSLPHLQRLRLARIGLRSGELEVLADLKQLQSLDVSRTGLDSGAMPWLRKMPLRWFDASHTCFGDRALANLSNCRQLQELRLERTCVTDAGLSHLRGMPNLRYLNLKRCPVSLAEVKKLSDGLPGCLIEWEPLRFLTNGKVNGSAARRGRVRLGKQGLPDPRASRRAGPPVDSVSFPGPTIVWPLNSSQYPVPQRNGYFYDVF